MAVNMAQAGQPRLITKQEYEQMVQVGVFPADDYGRGHPTARDVLLVIEVADTSADYDRNVKIPLYGRAGILEAWLIDLPGLIIEVYRGPNSSGYREKNTYGPGDHLAPLALPDLSLSVAEILGADA